MNRDWVRLAGLLLLIGLTACGGSGDGNHRENLLPYTGLVTPAPLNSANVVDITELATLGAAGLSGNIPDLGTGALAAPRKLTVAAGAARTAVARALQRQEWTEYGTCGGRMDVDISANSSTGEFSATMVATDFCVDGETMDGEMELVGRLDGEALRRLRIDFILVTISDAETDFTISGTMAEDFTGTNPELTMSVNYRDNVSAKIYRFADYLITTTYLGEGYSEILSGRFFHPDYGYVEVSTTEPFFFAWSDNVPLSGEAVCTGAAGSKSKFTVLSAAAYSISADFDGNGDFADFSTGPLHYPDRNSLPVISAGDDFAGNIGCGELTVSGATAIDADSDPLTLSWTFAATPEGSAAVISGADTLSPSFTPDRVGQYALRLSVSDDIGGTVEDTVTVTVYGDLFCLNGQTYIPAAEASMPRAVAVGDVTGDGRNDVVFLTSSTNRVDSDPSQDYHLYVLAQTAQGTLATPQSYPAGDGNSLAVADFNGDGRNDVAVSSRTGVGLFYQSPQGTLATMQLLPFGETIADYEPHALVAADFTGDGRSDLVSVYSDFYAAKIRLYAQTAAGALGAPALFTTDPGSWTAKAADFNGDQQTDLILTSNQQGKGSVYLGVFAQRLLQSGGSLTAPVAYLFDNTLSPQSAYCGAPALADLNHDARPDLVTSCLQMTSETSNFLRLYPLLADGSAGSPVNLNAPETYRQLEVFELNGDGNNDLLGLASGTRLGFDVFRVGNGGLGAAESYPARSFGNTAQAFAVGDVNGDGSPDVVITLYAGWEGGNGLLVVPGNPNRQ